jgi:hypothetical protein
MTNTTITLAGVPVTDTLRVMEILDEFINERIAVCEELAEEFDEVEFYSPDEFEHLPITQSVSWRHCVIDIEEMRRHRGNRIGVRKNKETK